VRIDDHVWNPAKEIAEQRGETITDVVERALRRYTSRHRHLLDEEGRRNG